MWTDLRRASICRKARLQLHRADIESLETRIALAAGDETPALVASEFTIPVIDSGGISLVPEDPAMPEEPQVHPEVEVTATLIITEHENIPRFAAQPTIGNVRSGLWSDPSIWSLGRVPVAGDRVAIAPDTIVTYTVSSNARLDALEISGTLTFSTTLQTRLTVANLTVMPDGTLEIGAPANPLAPQARAEIVIADKPIDLSVDPRQYGTGLIALGKVTMHGAPLDQTWSRVATEPRAGDASLLVDGDLSGWRVGDVLVLPDTRQVRTTDEARFMDDQLAPQWEEVAIRQIDGNRVILNRALAFDHLGARNTSGALELLPHVAHLTRNVVIRSENPNGTRGHTFFTARADVDIRYVRFLNLGRTDAFQPLDSATFDEQGQVTHVGTNQIGRYAVHLHHLMGPENPTNTGYQFTFVGNTVDRSRKWGVAVHDTSYGLVKSNVIYHAQGAGFVTEDGSEVNNQIINNITIRIQGTHVDGKAGTADNDYGRGGSGFWFRRTGNVVIGNVAADSTYAGFVIDGYFDLGEITVPAFRGANKHEPDQGKVLTTSSAGVFYNNEAYGMSEYGLWTAFPQGNNLVSAVSTLYVNGLRLWNIHHVAVVAYHTSFITFNNLLILGDRSALDRNDTGPYGMDLKAYENWRLTIRNSRIEGVYFGIYAPKNDASEAGIDRPTVIENSTLKNYINIVVSPAAASSPVNGNALVVRNVKFTLVPNLASGPAPPATVLPTANIYMFADMSNADLTKRSVVQVDNFNQVPGDDFQVFYHEQAPSFVLPKTDPALLWGRDDGQIGSPVAGLTNQANWLAYGIALAGGLLPEDATTRAGINGLVAAIQDTTSAVPRLVIVTPWAGAVVEGNTPVRIRYNLNGTLPAGASVYFSIDGAPAFTRFKDGGVYDLAPGQHLLRAFIGDAAGLQWPGTLAVVRPFSVQLPGGDLVAGGRVMTDAPLAAVASALSIQIADDEADLLAAEATPSNRRLGQDVR